MSGFSVSPVQLARQSQMPPGAYHEKHREHPDDGESPDLYGKGHPYSGYPGYVMMSNVSGDSFMSNGSLSPPMARTVSPALLSRMFHGSCSRSPSSLVIESQLSKTGQHTRATLSITGFQYDPGPPLALPS
uniref:CTNNB1 binding N-teminal domain-containing protein n=1 Tax=Paramormyrops kingsleyae TaxID=1676925 RepID=A0A3B3T2P1_9TELE